MPQQEKLPKKTYPAWISVAICVAALIYFVSPVDIVPDILFGFGQLDDAAILVLAATQAIHAWKAYSAKRVKKVRNKLAEEKPPVDVDGHEVE